jgi:hypothetical protein
VKSTLFCSTQQTPLSALSLVDGSESIAVAEQYSIVAPECNYAAKKNETKFCVRRSRNSGSVLTNKQAVEGGCFPMEIAGLEVMGTR